MHRPVRRSQTRPNASSPLKKQHIYEYSESSSTGKQGCLRGVTTDLPTPLLCGGSLTQCQPKSHLDGRQCHTHPCCGLPDAGSPLELLNPTSAMNGHNLKINQRNYTNNQGANRYFVYIQGTIKTVA